METAFWDRKGVLIAVFILQWTTIMSEMDCETLKELLRAIQKMSGI
jgi:hypothetical protein